MYLTHISSFHLILKCYFLKFINIIRNMMRMDWINHNVMHNIQWKKTTVYTSFSYKRRLRSCVYWNLTVNNKKKKVLGSDQENFLENIMLLWEAYEVGSEFIIAPEQQQQQWQPHQNHADSHTLIYPSSTCAKKLNLKCFSYFRCQLKSHNDCQD